MNLKFKLISFFLIQFHVLEAKVTFSSLRYMKPEHIKEAIPPLGLRMEFEEKFFVWKKNVVRYMCTYLFFLNYC